MRSGYLQNSRGSALITVTLIGFFVMLLAVGLINHFVVAEANAVAESLARTRIYWAMTGHINYALSRIRRQGLCAGTCVNDDDGTADPTDDALANRADNLRTYLVELDNAGNQRDWDFGNNYVLGFTFTVTDGPFPTPDNNDGRLRATVTLVPIASSDFETLVKIEQRMRDRLQVDVCVSAPCGAPNGSSSGANLIEALQRK